MHKILLFRVMLCAIVLLFGATYAITLFVDFFLCVKHTQWLFYNFVCLKQEKSLLEEIVQLIVVFLQRNSSSLSLYVFPSSDALILKHHSELQFLWMLNMCPRGALLASLNSSIFFPYYFLSCTPNIFWAGGHLLWCTRITDPYFRWK